jgi:2-polyprenyl-6-hydroxyphenyl methylase/3-demethylubiquinone-9 3-methyltransferase
MVAGERQTGGGSVSSYYERYWRREGGSPAEGTFAFEERKARLRQSLAGIPAGAPVLDAGCGSGQFLLFLSGLGYIVTGVDLSPAAISKARAVVPGVRLEVASLERGLPFASRTFAAVWCTEVLEHLFDIHAALVEMNRVLIPGGLLVLTAPYHGRVKNLLIALGGFERHYNPYLSHIRFFTRKSLGTCIVNGGFTVLSWGGVGRYWPLWMSHFLVARKTAAPSSTPEIIG